MISLALYQATSLVLSEEHNGVVATFKLVEGDGADTIQTTNGFDHDISVGSIYTLNLMSDKDRGRLVGNRIKAVFTKDENTDKVLSYNMI